MTVTPNEARAILNGLRRDGVVADIDPVLLGEILAGQADAYAETRRENAELLGRLHAIRQTVFPHLWERTPRGELACDIEAEADPHPEQEATA